MIDNGIHKSDRTNGRQSIRNASSVFFDIYDAKSLCDSLVEGGRKGISVQSAFSSEEEVQVKAIYAVILEDIYEGDGQGYILRDMGSTNGTWLNGKKIKRGNQEQLEDGAVIRFAKKEYEFLIQDI